MAVVKCKPTSAGRRHAVKVRTADLYKGRPLKSLVVEKRGTGGRNSFGRITTRQIGGGHKQNYRLVDFKRDKDGIPAKIVRLEYDPNRSANIALCLYADGAYRYILAPKGLKVGDKIESGNSVEIKTGNALPMHNIPVGTTVHAVELYPGKGAQLARSAGSYAQILAREGSYVTLRLRSGEMRKVLADGKAVIGEVGNGEHMLELTRQGRCKALARNPSYRPRYVNEPYRPSARRWRGTQQGHSACYSLGSEVQGLQDPQEQTY